MTATISLLRRKLAAYHPTSKDGTQRMRSSVLIPILQNGEDMQILLTKRTEKVKYHKGEISFPGGMYEENDGNALTTAVRESMEEIGLRQADVDILGRLDDMNTFTGFVITPYVGLVPYPYDFVLNPDEVSYLIYLPMPYLLSCKYAVECVEFGGAMRRAPAIYYEGERIWGATCRILLQFRRIVQDEEV